MLLALAGRRHDVTTAYRVSFGGRTLDRAVTTTVSFRSLQPAEVDAYVASRRVAGQGRRLRRAGTRGRVRDRAARLAHERHRPAARRGAGRSAGAGGAAGATRRPGSASGRGRDARRGDRGQPRPACARASPPPRAPPAARPSPSACSRSARRCPPTTCAPRSPPASAPSARTTPRSCATRAPCSPGSDAAGAARMALHRPAAEQQGEVRRGQGRAAALGRFARAARRRRGARRAAGLPGPGQRRRRGQQEAASRPPTCPRCSIASRRWRTCAATGLMLIPPRGDAAPPLRGAARAARPRGARTPARTSTCASCRWG